MEMSWVIWEPAAEGLGGSTLVVVSPPVAAQAELGQGGLPAEPGEALEGVGLVGKMGPLAAAAARMGEVLRVGGPGSYSKVGGTS